MKSESVADVLAQGHRLSVREDDRQRDDGVQVLCAVTAKKSLKNRETRGALTKPARASTREEK